MYHLSKNNNRRNSNSWDNGVSSDESDRPWDECASSTIQAKREEQQQREKEQREKEEQRERYYEYQKQRQQRILEEEKQRRELEERKKKRRHQARNEAEQNRRKSIPTTTKHHASITTENKNDDEWHQQQRRQKQVVQKLVEQRESPQKKKKKQQNSPFRERTIATTSNNTSTARSNNNEDNNNNSEVFSSIAHYSNQIMNTIQSSWTGTITTTSPTNDELQQQDATTTTPPRPNRRFTEVLIGTDEEEIIERIYTPDRKLYIRPNAADENNNIDIKPTSTKSTTELSPNSSDKDSLFGFDSFVKERTTPTRGGTSPSSFNNDDDNSSMDATMHIQTTKKKRRCNRVLWSIMSIIIVVVITVGILFWLRPSILFQNNKSINLENDLEQYNEEPNNNSSSSSITTIAPITALPSSQEEIVATQIPSTTISSNETITSVPTYSFNFTQDMFLPTTTPSSSSSLQATSSFPSSSSPTTAVPSSEPTSIPTTSMPSFLPSYSPTTVSPTFAPSSSPSEKEEESSSLQYDGFAFYLMGDVPYAPWEEIVLQEQLENMTSTYNSSYHLFAIHVGDFQKPKRNQCRESMYRNFRSRLLRYGPVPTYVLAGDNDWIDCPNPQDAIQHYRNYFVYDDYIEQWTRKTTVRMNVTHQTGAYPELFRFVHNSVMILSVHLTDTKPNDDDADEFWKAEWKARMEANIDWVWTSIKNYVATTSSSEEEELRGLILVGHGQYSKDVREFFVGISELFLTEIHGLRRDFPVMYLHGDGHKWDFNTRVSSTLNWYNFWDIQVDQGANADPCIVEIAPQRNDGTMIPLTKEHELQYVFGNGLFRIDRQRGLYAEDNDEIQK